MQRAAPELGDHSTAEAALALGRRFRFDEAHASQVARVAVRLFDDLAELHRLPALARKVLEAAALLHDVGNSVSYAKHHKHTYYLVANADIPGFADRERQLVALVGRYHRRSPPERDRVDLRPLSESEFRMVRKLAILLRVADSLDRSHHQPVRKVHATVANGAVRVRLRSRSPLDLEMWDAAREAALFRRVFGRRLELTASRR
jgi:exopolyphosphatase / guanosine-5'-triphosphate,3'-diphosphate pyrophosphatase